MIVIGQLFAIETDVGNELCGVAGNVARRGAQQNA
jgi:hypothetical protein